MQGSYGLYKNTWLSARWLSANQIDSFAPGKSTKLSSDILQLDLNARFLFQDSQKINKIFPFM